MKKLLLIAFLATFTVCINAQNEPPRDGGNGNPQGMKVTPKEKAAKVAQALDLTPEQTAQLEEFYTQQDKQMTDMRAQNKENRENMRNQMMEQRKSDDAALENILGKEKFQKYVEMRQKMMRERWANRPNQP